MSVKSIISALSGSLSLLSSADLTFLEARAPDEPNRDAEVEGGKIRSQTLLCHGRN